MYFRCTIPTGSGSGSELLRIPPMPADTEGEEVTEPTMYRCCYWGHLNLMGCIDANGVAATPNFEFLGSQSGGRQQVHAAAPPGKQGVPECSRALPSHARRLTVRTAFHTRVPQLSKGAAAKGRVTGHDS